MHATWWAIQHGLFYSCIILQTTLLIVGLYSVSLHIRAIMRASPNGNVPPLTVSRFIRFARLRRLIWEFLQDLHRRSAVLFRPLHPFLRLRGAPLRYQILKKVAPISMLSLDARCRSFCFSPSILLSSTWSVGQTNGPSSHIDPTGPG